MKFIIIFIGIISFLASCNIDTQQHSDSGVAKATTAVQTDANGRTIEQETLSRG